MGQIFFELSPCRLQLNEHNLLVMMWSMCAFQGGKVRVQEVKGVDMATEDEVVRGKIG